VALPRFPAAPPLTSMPLPPTHTHLNERKKNSAESADASELIRDPHADKKAKAASKLTVVAYFLGLFLLLR